MYAKYHGCGNDFIIGLYQEGIDYSSFAQTICNRNIGFGADGLLIANKKGLNYEMILYNADGSRAPMCGNGIRCFCAYLLDEKLVDELTIFVDTLSGIRTIKKVDDLFIVNMGTPCFDGYMLDIDEFDSYRNITMEYMGKKYLTSAVFMTTHHLVIITDDLNIGDDVGHYFCTNPIFKKGINVNFVQIQDENNISIKTYERGVGWTRACGSGACATYVVLSEKGLVKNEVNVLLQYGFLKISRENNDIIMKGPAQKIASISID